MKTIQEFYTWERATRDTIDVKKIYIDIANGDLVAGILLSQIIYWYLPDKNNKSKLTIFKDDRWWIAKGREDWWDEIRISPKQFDRAVKLLEDRNLVVSHIYQFGGKTIKHISLNEDVLLTEVNRQLDDKSGITQKANPDLTISENPVCPKVKGGFTLSDNSYTENTSDITAENCNPSITQSYDDRQTDNYPEELKTILDNAELEAFEDGIQRIMIFAIEDLYFNMGSAKIAEYPLSIIRSRLFDVCYPVLSLAWRNYCTIKANSGITNHRRYLAKCILSALIELPMSQESSEDNSLPSTQRYIRIREQVNLYIKENIDQNMIISIGNYPFHSFGRILHTNDNRKLIIFWDRERECIKLKELDSSNLLNQEQTK